MKAKLIAIMLGTCVCTLLTDCTIEKRIFQKGYHIEWKKKASSGRTSEEVSMLQNVSDDHSEKQKQEEKPTVEEYAALNSTAPENTEIGTISFYTETPPTDQPKVSEPGMKLSGSVPESQTKKPDLAAQKDEDVQSQLTPRKFEPVGIASFVFYFLGLGLGLCAIVATNPVAVLGFTALLLLLALILGIVSVVRFRRNRELYEWNLFGYFGLIASAGTLVLGIFILTITAILFLSGWPG
jgi:hypothetical protein